MTMLWQAHQDALKAWVEGQLQIPALWHNEAEGFKAKTRARLSVLSSAPRGVDQLRWAQDAALSQGEDFIPTVSGLRDFTFSVHVQSRDQRPECAARWYLEKLRASVHKPSVRKALLDAGLGFQTSDAIQNLDEVIDGRMESRATLDFHFGAAVNDRDTDEGNSFVERVGIAAELTNPSGSDVGWVEDEFGDITP